MTKIHDSDCALHNEPAYPNGPCDCSVSRSPTAGDEGRITGIILSCARYAERIGTNPNANPFDVENAKAITRLLLPLLAGTDMSARSPAAPADGVVEALRSRRFMMTEPYLSGYRLIIGFNSLVEAQAAQEAIASSRLQADTQGDKS